MTHRLFSDLTLLFSLALSCSLFAQELSDDRTVRVFIFAGQSNMVGSDSRVQDIKRYPPFAGLESSQENVHFSYSIGRENKTNSNGWVDLQPVNNTVGPELSFARKVSQNIKAPIAIIKCAAGGTHLGGDWTPDDPIGFKMYPLTLNLVKSSLAELDSSLAVLTEGWDWGEGITVNLNTSKARLNLEFLNDEGTSVACILTTHCRWCGCKFTR